MQCLVAVTAAGSNMWSGLEFKCFGRPPEAKMWRTLCPNCSPKQLAALLGQDSQPAPGSRLFSRGSHLESSNGI